MDSARRVTSIGTTFGVGVCFGFQQFSFWKKWKIRFDRFIWSMIFGYLELFSIFFPDFRLDFFKNKNVLFLMKMDSAGGVTSIGTTFEVGMFFGLHFVFENCLKKSLVERIF